jgi:hypothetical protein
VSAVVSGAVLLGAAGDARADGPVTGTGKGIVGGALLGAEVATITMAVIGIEAAWPYFVFGGVGALGGGIGGYFVETAAPAEVPLYMLAGGMALVIPAVVASLNATSYKPPESDVADPSVTEPAPESPEPSDAQPTSSVRSRKPRRSARAAAQIPRIPTALFDIYRGDLALGAPAVEVRALYTERERQMFGVDQGHEVRVPVFKAVF